MNHLLAPIAALRDALLPKLPARDLRAKEAYA